MGYLSTEGVFIIPSNYEYLVEEKNQFESKNFLSLSIDLSISLYPFCNFYKV